MQNNFHPPQDNANMAVFATLLLAWDALARPGRRVEPFCRSGHTGTESVSTCCHSVSVACCHTERHFLSPACAGLGQLSKTGCVDRSVLSSLGEVHFTAGLGRIIPFARTAGCSHQVASRRTSHELMARACHQSAWRNVKTLVNEMKQQMRTYPSITGNHHAGSNPAALNSFGE